MNCAHYDRSIKFLISLGHTIRMIFRCGGKLEMTPDSCDKQVKRRSNLGPYRKMESALKLHEPAHQVTYNKGQAVP